jgi:hypothetical protein
MVFPFLQMHFHCTTVESTADLFYSHFPTLKTDPSGAEMTRLRLLFLESWKWPNRSLGVRYFRQA